LTIGPRQRLALGIALGLAVGVAIVALAAARAAAILQDRRDELLGAVASFIGWPITAEALEVTWWPPSVVARQVRVPDVSPYGPGDLAYADEARFDFELLPLLRGDLAVNDIRLQAPVVRIVRGADGGWNLSRQVAPEAVEPQAAGRDWPAPRVVVDTVRVRNARLTYRDRAIPGLGELEVRSINLRLRNGRGGLVVDFNGQALGGPEENVEGRMRIPGAGDGAERGVTLDIEASRLQAARIPEIVSVLRGRMPFGLAFGGELVARVHADMRAAWPPGSAKIDVALDAGDATVRAAGGWVDKRSGSLLAAEIGLRADGEALAVERALLRLAGSEIRAEADGPAGKTGQPPLAISVDPLRAETLAQWVPALAVVRPRGALQVSGRIAPAGGPLAGELHVRAGALALEAEGAPVDAAASELRLVFSEDGDRVLGSLRVDDLRGSDVRAASLEAEVGGPLARPLTLNLTAEQGSVRGAPVERLRIEATVLEDGAEIRALRMDGLGGALAAHGSVERRAADGPWEVSVEPQWEGIDLAAVLLALGEPARGTGTLSGKASLATAAEDGASALANLAGEIEVTLSDGSLADLNVAGATLDNLRGIPRLREAVERRARERVPELLASTSEVSLLVLRGAVAQGAVAVSELDLESEHYALAARGRIALDGGTDLAGTLTLSPAAADALVSDAGVVQLLASPGGQVRIPVTVRGSYPRLTSAPTSEFVSRLMARAITAPGGDGGGGWLRRLLGRGERQDEGAGGAP
jgi:hypothetical protein